MKKKGSSLKKRLNTLLLVCLAPLAIMIVYLIVSINRFSERYDVIVENITMANAYNIDFKEEMDYLIYIIVVNSERAQELVDTEQPQKMIDEARGVFENLYDLAETAAAKEQLTRIVKSLNTLEERVGEIEKDALVNGSYDKNMQRLDLDIRILTDLIQDQIQEYIYDEARNLEVLREEIRADVERAIQISVVVLVGILVGAIAISRRVTSSITEPIQKLCEVTRLAAQGDFAVRAQESDDELAVLNSSFNSMVGKIGNLVEGIRREQRNQRITELKLLQAQINPHFLYNTLDTIIWLAETNEREQVVKMVSALSDFFRATLSQGRDYITVQEEEVHIRSYLQIQQFRYQDILRYEVSIEPELYQCQVLKMTLQPLVENALYHGIKNKRGLGRIRVTGQQEGGKLIFKVWDNGKGMEPERLNQVRKIISGEKEDEDSSSSFGLFNVAQRIRLNYGKEEGRLTIESVQNEWTECCVQIPAVK